MPFEDPTLDRPAFRILADVYDVTSFPLTLPVDLSTPPKRWSTGGEDTLYPPGGGQYERRIVKAEVRYNQITGGIEEAVLLLSNVDGALNGWLPPGEMRGKRVDLHLLELGTESRAASLETQWFQGNIQLVEAPTLATMQVLLAAADLGRRTTLVPRETVTTSRFPNAPETSLGVALPRGIGICKRIPCPRVSETKPTVPAARYEHVAMQGNAAIEAVYAGDTRLRRGIDYIPLHRAHRVHGRWCSGFRFPESSRFANDPITADVQRRFMDVDQQTLSQWFWAGDFRDDLGGRHATSTTLTTADLITGRSGSGLGALQFNGTSDYLEMPGANRLATQVGSLTFELMLQDASSGTRTIAYSPRYDRDEETTELPGGWFILETVSGGVTTLSVHARIDDDPTEDDALVSIEAVVPRDVWQTITITWGGLLFGQRLLALFVEGLPVDAATYAHPIRYDRVQTPLTWGRDRSFPAFTRFRLGPVRFDSAARSSGWARRAHWLATRNPVEGLREFVEGNGELVDPTSYEAVAAVLEATHGGRLRADGAVTQPTSYQLIENGFGYFRELATERLSSGKTAFRVWEEAA